MTALALTIIGTSALLYAVRLFALYIAQISEGERPDPFRDELYGDYPNVPIPPRHGEDK